MRCTCRSARVCGVSGCVGWICGCVGVRMDVGCVGVRGGFVVGVWVRVGWVHG